MRVSAATAENDSARTMKVLIDREDANICQDDFRTDDIGSTGAVIRALVVLRKNDVDPVVRQNKAAGAGLRRDFGRKGTHAGGQDRRHEARSIGLDQLLFTDRLACEERGT